MHVPYVYLVKNKTTGLKYVGVKYEKNCRPELFWVTYFTSSNAIHNLIKLYGEEDFKFKIIKTFKNQHDAIIYEAKLLQIACSRKDYLNMHAGYSGNLSEDQFKQNQEQQKIRASIIGKQCYQNKTGLFSLSPEERSKISQLSGKKAGEINKKLGRAIFDPEVRKRQHETLRKKQVSAYYDPELKKEIGLKGGQNGIFSKKYYEKHNLSEDDRIEKQRDRGRRGGPKNKGFKWYNDGINSFKYTKKQQEKLPFNQFLIDNPNFKNGPLLKSTIKGKIYVTDGVKNFYIFPENFDESIHTKLYRKKKNEN